MSNADGVWNTVTNTPMGAQNATLTLATDGDTLTGSMASPQGTIDIEDGVVGRGLPVLEGEHHLADGDDA